MVTVKEGALFFGDSLLDYNEVRHNRSLAHMAPAE